MRPPKIAFSWLLRGLTMVYDRDNMIFNWYSDNRVYKSTYDWGVPSLILPEMIGILPENIPIWQVYGIDFSTLCCYKTPRREWTVQICWNHSKLVGLVVNDPFIRFIAIWHIWSLCVWLAHGSHGPCSVAMCRWPGRWSMSYHGKERISKTRSLVFCAFVALIFWLSLWFCYINLADPAAGEWLERICAPGVLQRFGGGVPGSIALEPFHLEVSNGSWGFPQLSSRESR